MTDVLRNYTVSTESASGRHVYPIMDSDNNFCSVFGWYRVEIRQEQALPFFLEI